jgi:flagellar FliJ protein
MRVREVTAPNRQSKIQNKDMPFRFSLQAVLRCRESFERRERQRLQMITREVVKAKQQRDQAKVDRATSLAEFQKRLHEGMNVMEMQFELACDRARLRRIAALNDHFAKLEDLRRRQVDVFRKAQQQRKILENLRERQLAAYQLIQARREQQQMDDRFLITHARHFSSSQLPHKE